MTGTADGRPADRTGSLKSQFIATASHELRTPLSIIKGFTNLLTRRDDFGFDRETEMQYLGLIDSQVNALTSLVDDMLSASRIESGRVRLQREPVELLPMIQRQLATFSIAAAERQIEVRLDQGDPAIAYADSQQAEQVFVNLVSNAIKYSYDGGSVHVRLVDGPEYVTISARDMGVGSRPIRWISSSRSSPGWRIRAPCRRAAPALACSSRAIGWRRTVVAFGPRVKRGLAARSSLPFLGS